MYIPIDDPENSDKKIKKLVNTYSPSTYIEEELIENNFYVVFQLNLTFHHTKT